MIENLHEHRDFCAPDESKVTDVAVDPAKRLSEIAQEKGERILGQMAEVNQYWLFGPTKEVRNYSYEFINSNKETTRIEISDPYAVERRFRQGIIYYSVLHELLSDPSSAIITAIQDMGKEIRLDFAFNEPLYVECGNGLSETTGGYFSGPVHRGTLWIDAEKMVPDRVKTDLLEEEFEEYMPVGKSHYVPERVKVVHRIGRSDWKLRLDWAFNLHEPGLWLFHSGRRRPSEEQCGRQKAEIENVTINDPSIVETKVPSSNVD